MWTFVLIALFGTFVMLINCWKDFSEGSTDYSYSCFLGGLMCIISPLLYILTIILV